MQTYNSNLVYRLRKSKCNDAFDLNMYHNVATHDKNIRGRSLKIICMRNSCRKCQMDSYAMKQTMIFTSINNDPESYLATRCQKHFGKTVCSAYCKWPNEEYLWPHATESSAKKAHRHSVKNNILFWQQTHNNHCTKKPQFCPGGPQWRGETWHAPETLKQHWGSGRSPEGTEKAVLASSNNAAAVSCVGFLLRSSTRSALWVQRRRVGHGY